MIHTKQNVLVHSVTKCTLRVLVAEHRNSYCSVLLGQHSRLLLVGTGGAGGRYVCVLTDKCSA